MKLVILENATTKCFKPRPVLYAIHGAIEKDFEHLENLRIIKKMHYRDCCAPTVAVAKPIGIIQIQTFTGIDSNKLTVLLYENLLIRMQQDELLSTCQIRKKNLLLLVLCELD